MDLLGDALHTENLKETAYCRILYCLLQNKDIQRDFIKYSLPDIDCSFDQTLKTKKDKQNHGYGLKSIRRIVHQYHGEMSIQYDDKLFIIQLSLLLQ